MNTKVVQKTKMIRKTCYSIRKRKDKNTMNFEQQKYNGSIHLVKDTIIYKMPKSLKHTKLVKSQNCTDHMPQFHSAENPDVQWFLGVWLVRMVWG